MKMILSIVALLGSAVADTTSGKSVGGTFTTTAGNSTAAATSNPATAGTFTTTAGNSTAAATSNPATAGASTTNSTAADATSTGAAYNSPAGLVNCDKFKSCSASILSQTGSVVPGAECFRISLGNPAS